MEKPEFAWENLSRGMVIGERVITVTPEMVAAHCGALGADRPWYRGESPFGGPVAPPMIFINDLLAIYDENFRRFGTIHARLSWRFHRPARVGERVHQKVTVQDLYVRRGKGWIVSELAARGEAGDVICTSLHTSVLSLTRAPEEPSA
ncbi:MAG: MaoC family dehydratase [Candidatus Tectomicrobia bacterium]|nr:MaoC family dehydratase [Candidatus Tectomicrobia bacterium]